MFPKIIFKGSLFRDLYFKQNLNLDTENYGDLKFTEYGFVDNNEHEVSKNEIINNDGTVSIEYLTQKYGIFRREVYKKKFVKRSRQENKNNEPKHIKKRRRN